MASNIIDNLKKSPKTILKTLFISGIFYYLYRYQAKNLYDSLFILSGSQEMFRDTFDMMLNTVYSAIDDWLKNIVLYGVIILCLKSLCNRLHRWCYNNVR